MYVYSSDDLMGMFLAPFLSAWSNELLEQNGFLIAESSINEVQVCHMRKDWTTKWISSRNWKGEKYSWSSHKKTKIVLKQNIELFFSKFLYQARMRRMSVVKFEMKYINKEREDLFSDEIL